MVMPRSISDFASAIGKFINGLNANSIGQIPNYCPYCKVELKRWNVYCPKCKAYVSREFFSLTSFLKNNYQLFALIGILGTLTTLLPAISESYYGLSDLNAIPYPQNFLLMASLAINSIMIVLILVLVFFEALANRHNEVTVWNFRGTGILRKGDFGRIALIFGFLLPLCMTAFYLSNVFPVITSIISFAVCFGILAGFYFIISIALQRTAELRFMCSLISLLFLVLLILLIISAIYVMSPKPPQDVNVSNIFIETDVNYYTPDIVNSIGVGFIPTNCSGKNCASVNFHWATNYGYFIDWNDGSTRIKNLGNSTYHNVNTIYWTYGMSNIGEEKPPIKITLTITNSEDGSVLANRTMNLTWVDIDVLAV